MQLHSVKKGILLVNVGTPDSPAPQDVRKYLREFLMDPEVIDIPYVFRWVLVNWGILPRRSYVSAELYQKIWSGQGSPLLVHLNHLTREVQKTLGSEVSVKGAMRYGSPSIRAALESFREEKVDKLVVFPLYPQYSTAATRSAITEVRKQMENCGFAADVQFIEPFYSHPLFIQSFTGVIQRELQGYECDHLLFSFHGLPERQLKKLDSSGSHCLIAKNCCDKIEGPNLNCYRAQCEVTAREIAASLQISSDRYTVCFQSRLGKTPWIQPFTDEFYRILPSKGVKRLAVACPAFVADCLETLEEVQIRGKEEFQRHGGEDLKLIPSLNSDPAWVQAVSQIVSTRL